MRSPAYLGVLLDDASFRERLAKPRIRSLLVVGAGELVASSGGASLAIDQQNLVLVVADGKLAGLLRFDNGVTGMMR